MGAQTCPQVVSLTGDIGTVDVSCRTGSILRGTARSFQAYVRVFPPGTQITVTGISSVFGVYVTIYSDTPTATLADFSYENGICLGSTCGYTPDPYVYTCAVSCKIGTSGGPDAIDAYWGVSWKYPIVTTNPVSACFQVVSIVVDILSVAATCPTGSVVRGAAGLIEGYVVGLLSGTNITVANFQNYGSGYLYIQSDDSSSDTLAIFSSSRGACMGATTSNCASTPNPYVYTCAVPCKLWITGYTNSMQLDISWSFPFVTATTVSLGPVTTSTTSVALVTTSSTSLAPITTSSTSLAPVTSSSTSLTPVTTSSTSLAPVTTTSTTTSQMPVPTTSSTRVITTNQAPVTTSSSTRGIITSTTSVGFLEEAGTTTSAADSSSQEAIKQTSPPSTTITGTPTLPLTTPITGTPTLPLTTPAPDSGGSGDGGGIVGPVIGGVAGVAGVGILGVVIYFFTLWGPIGHVGAAASITTAGVGSGADQLLNIKL